MHVTHILESQNLDGRHPRRQTDGAHLGTLLMRRRIAMAMLDSTFYHFEDRGAELKLAHGFYRQATQHPQLRDADDPQVQGSTTY